MSERRELVRYTDTDGDVVLIAHDPVDDTGEDVLLVVQRHDGHSLAARLPVGVFRAVASELGGLS